MKTAIVTDSTADIPETLVEQQGIHVVPNVLIIDGRSLVDGKDISREAFYVQLPNMREMPTTSTASSGAYETLYEALLQKGAEDIISIHASSKLSGIFNAASAAAQVVSDRIRVIDSGQISLGLGFQVLAVAEAIASGMNINSVMRVLDGVRQRIRLVAMLDTLEYIRRSGRVSWARARLGNLIGLKPFIEVKDGDVIPLGNERTRGRGIARLKQILLNTGMLERLAILHSNAESDACELLANLNIILPVEPLVVNVTTIIGTHVGPNGLGFTAVTKRT